MLTHIPPPSEKRIAIRVSPNVERVIRSGHPWLFANSIREQSFQGKPGDLAVIFDGQRRFLAIGLYDPLSPIRVRILQAREPEIINSEWFEHKLQTAVSRRAPLLQTKTNGYRLVHGENDGLPGLVIDRYNQTMVMKLYSAAWVLHLPAVLAGLTAVTRPQQIILRLNRQMQSEKEWLYGLTDGQILTGDALKNPVRFLENGLTFEADVVQGQKTGFFLDQRENRARVEPLSAGKRVLNVFAYSGGFSLYAARGSAKQVLSLDLSQPALAAAGRNFRLNESIPNVAACEHDILAGDAFQVLPQLQEEGHTFDMVVLDPPAFAKRQAEVEKALMAYGRLVRLGLGVLDTGGVLVIASCSSRVDAETFFLTVHQAALQAGRPLQEMERTGHALDHPITFEEGAYLKCLFAKAP